MTLKAKSKKVKAGKKVTVKATVSPGSKKTTNTKLVWKTSNKKWATVSSKGVVTTKKAGAGKTVTIKATAKDVSKKKGTIKIKIMKKGVTKIETHNRMSLLADANIHEEGLLFVILFLTDTR